MKAFFHIFKVISWNLDVLAVLYPFEMQYETKLRLVRGELPV